jgi:hypothetical protein
MIGCKLLMTGLHIVVLRLVCLDTEANNHNSQQSGVYTRLSSKT